VDGDAAQITSLFLHWMPACVVWTLRWYPHRSTRLNFDAKSDEAKARWHHGSLLDLVLLPFLPYLLWAVAYYIKVAKRRLPSSPRTPSLGSALSRTWSSVLCHAHTLCQAHEVQAICSQLALT
jgi:hypothetical protein